MTKTTMRRRVPTAPFPQRGTETPMPDLNRTDCINETCPWSGKPVAEDSLTTYKGNVVGFCNPGCRDQFAAAVGHFEKAIEEKKEPR